MYEIVAFHVSHKNNAQSIEKHGLLSRKEIQKIGNIQFFDIADEDLITDIQAERVFNFLDPDKKTITEINLDLSEYVPFHFIRPVHRPEIVPADVLRWQKEYQNMLDYWVLEPDFLLKRSEYLICIGHWNSTWFGGPLLLNDFKIFTDLIKNPIIRRDILQKIPKGAHHFEKAFKEDIPNILEGKVKVEYLKPGSKYRHLMESCIFVKNRVPRDNLLRLLNTKEIKRIVWNWKLTIPEFFEEQEFFDEIA